MTKAFEKAGDLREDLLAAMSMPVHTDEHRAAKVEAVKRIYDILGIEEDARKEILRLHSQALSYVSDLSVSQDEKALLENYAAGLLFRNK